MWYHIFNGFVDNYNNLYNKKLLGFDFYRNNVGFESTKILNEIRCNLVSAKYLAKYKLIKINI